MRRGAHEPAKNHSEEGVQPAAAAKLHIIAICRRGGVRLPGRQLTADTLDDVEQQAQHCGPAMAHNAAPAMAAKELEGSCILGLCSEQQWLSPSISSSWPRRPAGGGSASCIACAIWINRSKAVARVCLLRSFTHRIISDTMEATIWTKGHRDGSRQVPG